MSTLGAMARAAEYAAATNAKQRQVSREAEDQKLPPRSAPVSLSAFTRNQQPSRNKGAKAWKPLTLDDIDDDSDDQPHHASSLDSPTEQAHSQLLLRRQPSATSQQAGAEDVTNPSVKVNIPHTSTPVGPRVLSDPRDRGGLAEQTSVRKPRPPPILAYPLPWPFPTSHAMNSSFQHPGFPFHSEHLVSASPFAFAGPPMLFQQQDLRATSTFPRIDLLPANDREQAASLPHRYNPARPSTQAPDQQTRYDGGQASHIRRNGTRTDPTSEGAGMSKTLIQSTVRPVVPGHPTGPPIPHEKATPPDHLRNEQMFLSESAESPLARGATKRLEPVSTVVGQHGPGSNRDLHRYDSPATSLGRLYGSSSHMQNHVPATTTDARAETTKTVLHGTEIDEFEDHATAANSQVPASNLHAPQNAADGLMPWQRQPGTSRGHISVPWEVLQPTTAQKEAIAKVIASQNLSSARIEALATAINNPAPGLDLPDPVDISVQNGADSEGTTSDSEEVVLGSEEWCQLKPPNICDRERGRRIMAKSARTVGFHWPVQSLRAPAEDRDALAVDNWFNEDKRSEQQTREDVWIIAEQHATRLRNADRKQTEADGQDTEAAVRGLNVALGDVVMNVCGYFDTIKCSDQPEDEFSKWKPIPEFALERGGLVSGLRANVSFFDDTEENYHIAPSRIARDPRFRPQGYDGMRSTPDEERKGGGLVELGGSGPDEGVTVTTLWVEFGGGTLDTGFTPAVVVTVGGALDAGVELGGTSAVADDSTDRSDASVVKVGVVGAAVSVVKVGVVGLAVLVVKLGVDTVVVGARALGETIGTLDGGGGAMLDGVDDGGGALGGRIGALDGVDDGAGALGWGSSDVVLDGVDDGAGALGWWSGDVVLDGVDDGAGALGEMIGTLDGGGGAMLGGVEDGGGGGGVMLDGVEDGGGTLGETIGTLGGGGAMLDGVEDGGGGGGGGVGAMLDEVEDGGGVGAMLDEVEDGGGTLGETIGTLGGGGAMLDGVEAGGAGAILDGVEDNGGGAILDGVEDNGGGVILDGVEDGGGGAILDGVDAGGAGAMLDGVEDGGGGAMLDGVEDGGSGVMLDGVEDGGGTLGETIGTLGGGDAMLDEMDDVGGGGTLDGVVDDGGVMLDGAVEDGDTITVDVVVDSELAMLDGVVD